MPCELHHGGLDVQSERRYWRADPRRYARMKDEVTPHLLLSQVAVIILSRAQAGSWVMHSLSSNSSHFAFVIYSKAGGTSQQTGVRCWGLATTRNMLYAAAPGIGMGSDQQADLYEYLCIHQPTKVDPGLFPAN